MRLRLLLTALVVAGRDGARWFAGLDEWSAWGVDSAPADTAWSIGREHHLAR